MQCSVVQIECHWMSELIDPVCAACDQSLISDKHHAGTMWRSIS